MRSPTIRGALSILTIGALISIVASAGVFVNMPTSISLTMTSPPYWFEHPTSQGVNVTLGPNLTSAIINITLSPTTELLKNPDFYYDADPWLYQTNISNLTVYWSPSDTGSSGGVVIATGTTTYNYLFQYVFLVQNFTVPTIVSTLNLSIRYKFLSAPTGFLVLHYIYADILKWNTTTNSWDLIASTSTRINTGTTYTYYNATITPSQNLVPGETYRIRAGYLAVSLLGASGTLDFRWDWIRLEMGSPYYVFAGEAVRVNGTLNVYARFYVTGFYSNSTVINADIYLENLTTKSTSVQIRNGNLTTASTSFILLKPSGSPLYVSGKISVIANTTVADGSVVIVRGFLHYTNGAFHVYYPVTIRIGG